MLTENDPCLLSYVFFLVLPITRLSCCNYSAYSLHVSFTTFHIKIHLCVRQGFFPLTCHQHCQKKVMEFEIEVSKCEIKVHVPRSGDALNKTYVGHVYYVHQISHGTKNPVNFMSHERSIYRNDTAIIFNKLGKLFHCIVKKIGGGSAM